MNSNNNNYFNSMKEWRRKFTGTFATTGTTAIGSPMPDTENEIKISYLLVSHVILSNNLIFPPKYQEGLWKKHKGSQSKRFSDLYHMRYSFRAKIRSWMKTLNKLHFTLKDQMEGTTNLSHWECVVEEQTCGLATWETITIQNWARSISSIM